MGFNMDMVFKIIIFAVPVLFAITVHEAAHGYAARYFGDRTAERLGRITLNPFKHIDLMGTIVLPIIILFATSGAFAFGYAKPVPVNMAHLRNPKRDMLWVALAGPVSNIIQTFIWAFILVIVVKVGISGTYLFQMAQAGIIINIILCVLNLFPLPPLDGGRVLVSLLPYPAARVVAQIEPYGFIIIVGLLFTNLLSRFWLNPLTDMGLNIINWLIFRPLGL